MPRIAPLPASRFGGGARVHPSMEPLRCRQHRDRAAVRASEWCEAGRCAADIRDMVAPRRERSSRSRSPPLATAREGEYAQGRSSPISLVCVGQLLDTRCVRGRSRFCPRVSGRRHASAHSARWCGAHREGPWRLGRRLPPGSRSGDRAARRFRPPQLPREEMHAAPPPPSQRAHGACRAHCPGSACRRVHEPCVCLKNVKTAASASRHPGTTSDHTRAHSPKSGVEGGVRIRN